MRSAFQSSVCVSGFYLVEVMKISLALMTIDIDLKHLAFKRQQKVLEDVVCFCRFGCSLHVLDSVFLV
jgi:hypothetical protein